ncbi:MAG: hypothetical protein OYG31_01350, partial [Candidatus Kaiserbacteria bacterium]|nr:hypothetical protein [Candidatus Kaiserbacteria bacterium]
YTVAFDGRGVLIEEGDSVDISIEVNTDMGTGEDIKFAIDDESDVYVVGASYKYGLPVDFGHVDPTDDTSAEIETVVVSTPSVIQSGMVSDGGRLKKSEFEDEVRYGRDVVIGARSFEFEGEDVDMEGLTFSVALGSYGAVSATESNWKTADEDSITLDNIRLVVDGEVVAYGDLLDSDGDQAEFDEPAAGATDDIELEIEFDDSFTIDVRDTREVIFEVVANLSRAWAHFDGAEISLTLTEVEVAEGRNSEEDFTASGKHFAGTINFEGVEIVGNEISFEITNSGIEDSEFVAGTEDVVFGSFEVDASETVDDIIAKELKVTFEGTGKAGSPNVDADLGHLDNCALYDESDDRIADGRSTLSAESDVANGQKAKEQMRFRFDSNTVIESGEEVEFAIRCSIDEDAKATVEYKVSVDTANDIFEYLIADDKFDGVLAGGSDTITVANSGRLIVTTEHPDDDESLYAQAVGKSGVDDVEVLEIELEAEEEDIRVTDIYLEGITVSGVSTAATVEDYLEEVVESMRIDLGNTVARPRDYVLTRDIDSDSTAEVRFVAFDNVNEIIEVGRSGSQTFDLSIDYSGITKSRGRSGAWIDAGNLVIEWEGVTSDEDGFTKVSVASDFTEVNVFPTVPTISSSQRTQTINNTPNEKLYEFTVRASDEGDVYLKQVALEITRGGATLKDVRVRRGTQSSSTIIGRANSDSSVAVTGNPKIAFDDVEIIDAGEEVTYSVYAHVDGLVDDKTLSVQLLRDTAIPAEAGTPAKVGKVYAAAIGNFVWSPDTLDKRGSTTDSANTDWYSGYAIFDDGDAEWWNSKI